MEKRSDGKDQITKIMKRGKVYWKARPRTTIDGVYQRKEFWGQTKQEVEDRLDEVVNRLAASRAINVPSESVNGA